LQRIDINSLIEVPEKVQEFSEYEQIKQAELEKAFTCINKQAHKLWKAKQQDKIPQLRSQK
jgi:hypothetical protein